MDHDLTELRQSMLSHMWKNCKKMGQKSENVYDIEQVGLYGGEDIKKFREKMNYGSFNDKIQLNISWGDCYSTLSEEMKTSLNLPSSDNITLIDFLSIAYLLGYYKVHNSKDSVFWEEVESNLLEDVMSYTTNTEAHLWPMKYEDWVCDQIYCKTLII